MPFFKMPDGRYFEYPDDVSFEDAATQAAQRFPKAFGMEKSGVSGALGKGWENLTSSLTTAVEAGVGDPNAAAKRALKRQKAAGEVYADETGLDKLQKRWDEEGLGGAFKEVMRQTPLVIAEQFPNLGASIASAKVGAWAGGTIGGVPGALIGGAAGAFLPSAAQQFGSNIERQAYEQQQRGEPVNIDVPGAAKNAAFQGALDVGGTGAALGKKMVNRILGQDVFKLVKEGATDEAQRLALSKIANDKFLPSLKGKKFGAAVKGAGKGILFEDLTEVGQQMLERAQAGLDLFSDDAYAEYADTAFQTTLMAGPLGTMGAYADRSGAKKQLQQLDRIKAANERAAEDERKAQPEYGMGLAEQRIDLHDQLNALNDEVKAAGKGLSKEQKTEFNARRTDLEQRLNDLDEEINSRPDKDQIYGHAQFVQQQRAAEAAGQPVQMGFPGMYQAPAAEKTEAAQAAPEITPLAEAQTRAPKVRAMLDKLVERMNKAVSDGDTATVNELMPKYRQLVDYYTQLEGIIENAPKVGNLEADLKKHIRDYKKAVDPNVGDVAAAEKALAKIKAVQDQINAAKAEQDMFTAEGAVSPEILRQNEAVVQKEALAEQYGQQQQDLFAQTEAEALGQPYTHVSEAEQQQLLSNLLAQQEQEQATATGPATYMDVQAYLKAKEAEEMGPQPSAEKPRVRTQAENRAADRRAKLISGEELEAEERTNDILAQLAEQQPEGKGDFANLLPTMKGTGAKFDPLLGRDPETRKMLDQFGFTKLVQMAGERDILPKDYVDFATKSDKYITSALNGFEKTLDELGETDWTKAPAEERAARYREAYAKSRGIVDAILRSIEATRYANGNAGLTNRQVFELHTKLREMFDAALENQSMRPDFRKNIARLKLAYKKPETKVLRGAERPEKQAPKFRLEATEEQAPREERVVEMERLDRLQRDLRNELYDAQKAGDKAAIASVNKQLAAVAAQRKTLGAPVTAISTAKNKLAGLQKLLSAAEFTAAERGKTTTPAVEKAKVKVEEAQAELDKIMAPPAAEETPEAKPPLPQQKGYQFKLFKDDAQYLRRQLAALARREADRDREIGELMRVALAKREKEANAALAALEAAYNEDKATYDEALAHALGVMTDIVRHKYLVKPEKAAAEAKDLLYKALQERTKLRKKILGSRKIQPHLMSFLQAFGGKTRTSQRKGPKFALSPQKNQELKQRLGLIQDVQDNADAAFKKYVSLPDPTETNMTPEQIQERMDAQVAYYSAVGMVKQMEQDLHDAGLTQDSAFSDVLGLTPKQVIEFSLSTEERAVLKEADALVNEAEKAMLAAEDNLEGVHQKLNMAERKREVINRRQFRKMRAKLDAIQKRIEAATDALAIPSPDKERLRKENEQRRTETSVAMAKVQEAAEKDLKDRREAEQRVLEAKGKYGAVGQRVVHVFTRDPITGKPVYKTSGSYVTEVYDPKTRTWAKLKDKAPLLQKQQYTVQPKETREQTATLKAMDKLYSVAEEERVEQNKVDKKLGRVTPQQLAENYLAMQKTYENFADAMPDDFRKDLEQALDTYKGILKTYNVDAMAFIDAKSTEKKRLAPLRTGKVREATEVDMTRVALERLLSDNAGHISGSKAVKGVTAMLEAFRDSKSFDQIKARFKVMQGERTRVSDSEFSKYAFERPQPAKVKLTAAERRSLPPELEAFGLEDIGILPESEQFDFSEQTISGMNFAEGKTSTNTSNGMKGALLGYFQNPAEFDKHVTVYQSVDEAKKSELGAKALSQASNPYRVQAFTDKDGHVYMIADAVMPGQELAVFLHEVGVHAGMERLIGAENMAVLSSQINQWAKLGENTLEGSIARKAVARAEKSSSANKSEERIAYFVEEAVKAGIDPVAVQKTGSPFAQWFRTLIAAMKSALRKIGLARFEDLTAQNIVDLAYGAAKLKMTGRWHGTAAQYRRFNHAFMGTGEGAQAFGWGTYVAERVGIAKGYWEKDVKSKETGSAGVLFDGVDLETAITSAWQDETAPGTELPGMFTTALEAAARDIITRRLTNMAPHIKVDAVGKVFSRAVEYAEDFVDFEVSEGLTSVKDAAEVKAEIKKLQKALTKLHKKIADRPLLSIVYQKPVGSLMYIDTAIHDNEYMDNDAFLREQPEILAKIKKGVPKNMLDAVEKLKEGTVEDLTGREFYTAMELLLQDAGIEQADKKISESLDKIGVKGLKFADAMSRGTSSARRKLETFTRRLAAVEAAIRDNRLYPKPAPFRPTKTGKLIGGEELREYRGWLLSAIEDAKAKLSPLTRNYIVFNDKNIVRVMSEIGADPDNIRFSESSILDMMKPSAGKFNSDFDAKYPGMSSFGDKLISKDKGIVERVAANAGGLRFAIQFVDRFAGLQKIATTMKDKLAGFQMMFWLRAFDQRNNLTAQAASVGVPYMREEIRADGRKEWTLDYDKNSSNLREVVQEVGKAMPDVGDANATMRMFSLFRMAKRVMRLNKEGKDGIAIALGRNLSAEERAEAMKQFKAALDFGNSNAHFKAADEMYTRYNRALINFLAQSGAISKEQAALLNKGGDYIGFYREKDGLIVDGEHNITMGDLTSQPYLKELLGGDTAIVDFRTSSLQNTSLIISMALNNLATRNTANTLTQLGLAKARSTKGPAADNVVRYKVHGEDWHIVVDPTEVEGQYGIPADLLVKGMRGVSTTLPAIVRLMQGPANLLRKGVTRMPTYMARQLVRDSLNATVAGGLDGMPLLNTLRYFGKETDAVKRIQAQGFGGGQLFSGTNNDIKRLMTDIMAGTNSWDTAMAWLDKMSHNADTATRGAAYDSFRKQGLSDMEALLACLEMTNFSKRGISPSMAHMATMIPFFNAQIQGLNALWQAFSGTGIASERLKLKNKLLKRGALMMGLSVAYALAMQDDEPYKNEDMDIKLNSWLVDLPGLKARVAIPIPFEVGMVFKAIPEALIIAAKNDKMDRDVIDSLGKMVLGTIPGGSSFFIPQAAKPAIEVLTGKNLFDFSISEGKLGELESAKMKQLEAGERVGPGTSGVAAALGGFLNVSPIKIDHLIRGYGGSMGAFLASAVGTVPDFIGKGKPPAPEGRLSDMALIGGLFRPEDGRGLIDRAFNKMEDVMQANQTYKKMVDDGRLEEAHAYSKKQAALIDANSLAGQFRQQMGEIASERRQIVANRNMTPKQKREAIDALRQEEIRLAKELNSI